MLSFDPLKCHSEGDKSLLNRVKNTGGDLENHIWMLLLPTVAVFGLF